MTALFVSEFSGIELTAAKQPLHFLYTENSQLELVLYSDHLIYIVRLLLKAMAEVVTPLYVTHAQFYAMSKQAREQTTHFLRKFHKTKLVRANHVVSLA